MNRLAQASTGVLAALLFFSAPVQANPTEHVVVMDNMRYGQIPGGLKVGDTVVWVNRDTVPHTVTARNRSFDVRIAPGRSVRTTLTKAGSMPFYCILHPGMRGTLTVGS